MILNIFICGIIPILTYNNRFIRQPKYLFYKIFFYFGIPLQGLAFTAGTYPDYVNNDYYNYAFRIDLIYQLVSFYVFFEIIRFLKNKLIKKIQKNKLSNQAGDEYNFIKNMKIVINFIYGQDKIISKPKDLINLGIHLLLIFFACSFAIVNLVRFYDWYSFYL